MNSLLTIGICVYNGEKTIGRTLNSVLEQTYRPIELIIVNDSSTDNTFNILNQFKINNEADDFKINIVNHNNNSGIAVTRNTCIHHATGKFFGFIDSDDTLEQNYGSVLVDSLEINDADIAVFDFYKVDNNNARERVRIFNNSNPTLKQYILSYPNPWNKMYLTKLLKQDPEPFRNYYYEDLASTHCFFLKANKIIYVNKSLINYYLGNGLSQCYDERTFQLLDIIKFRNNDFKQYPGFNYQNDLFLEDSVPRIFDQLIGLIQMKDNQKVIEFYDECIEFLNINFDKEWKKYKYFYPNNLILRMFRNFLKNKICFELLVYNPLVKNLIKKKYRL